MKSLQGQLLVATPRLPDENFFHTVVLMVEHNQDGALGVVLNRIADQSVGQLWAEVSNAPCTSEQKINLGGPVSGPLLAVHTNSQLSEIEIVAGVYLAARKEHLDELVQQNAHRYRVFLGHSGWGSGQLENELEQGAWLVTPATKEYIFHAGEEDLWEKATKYIGDSILLESLHIKRMPEDPSVN